MPVCEDCGCEVGIWEAGTICPTCLRTYTPIETCGLKGYDHDTVAMSVEIYMVMKTAGLLDKGRNIIHFTDDGFIIEHNHEAN